MPASLSPPVLSIRGLRKAYSDVVAVNGVDLDAWAGEGSPPASH